MDKRVPESRSINIYIHEHVINVMQLPLNSYANEAVSKALTQDPSFFTSIQVYRNISEYGRWLSNYNQGINKDKFQKFIAYCRKSEKFCQRFDKTDEASESKLRIRTNQNILFLAEIIKRHCGDLVPPSFIILTNLLSLRRIPLLCLSLGFLHLLPATQNIYHKARTTVIKISKLRNSLDKQMYNLYELQQNTSPVQLIQLFFQQHEKEPTTVLEKANFYRLAINLKDVNLRVPLNHNFIYVLRHLIIPEIRMFEPTILIVEDTYPVRQMLFEQETLAYMMQQLMELINCHCLYVKILGCHQQCLEYDMKLIKTNMESKNQDRDKLEEHLLKKPFGNAQQVTLFKRNLHRLVGIIFLGLLDCLPVYNLQEHYQSQPLTPQFVDGYCEFLKLWLSQTESLSFRAQLTEKLKLGCEIKQRQMAMMSNTMYQNELNPTLNSVFNIKSRNMHKLPVDYTSRDQYYMHYPLDILILFKTDEYYVISADTIKYTAKYFNASALPGQQNPNVVTECCLVASDKYLYRLFGRYLNSRNCSNRMFRLCLTTFEYEQFRCNVALERRCLSSGIYHKNRIYVFGGRLDCETEEIISRKVLVIVDDKHVKVEEKVSNQIFQEQIKNKLRVKPYLNNVIFPMHDECIVTLSTNAPNHNLLYYHQMYQSYYNCHKMTFLKQFRRLNETRELLGQAVGMDRKAFQNMLLKAITRCSYCVNRYVDEGMARVAVDVNGVLVLFEMKIHGGSEAEPILVSIVAEQLTFTHKIDFVK